MKSAMNPRIMFRLLRLAAIGGIWAKSHAKPHYVTDADVAQAAARIARSGPVDILLTHACPIGLADLTPTGRHGGQRCFLEAFNTIKPRVHLCGHLHVAQERVLKEEIRRLDGLHGMQDMNVAYVKNVLFKFFETDDRPSLVPVVATMLHLSPDEVRRLRESIKIQQGLVNTLNSTLNTSVTNMIGGLWGTT